MTQTVSPKLSQIILKRLQQLLVNAIPVIAIDGPSASGKGSVAKRVAQELGYHYLDSGALYRIVALAAQQNAIKWHEAQALSKLIPTLKIAFKNDKTLLNDVIVSEQIRSPAISNGASQISVHPQVRQGLLTLQHQFRQSPGLVADGRDMSSVVFTDAILKIFLTASIEERANRRYKELLGKSISASYKKILQDLQARDARDKTRSSAPLVQTKDAILLNTNTLNIEQAVAVILKKYHTIK